MSDETMCAAARELDKAWIWQCLEPDSDADYRIGAHVRTAIQKAVKDKDIEWRMAVAGELGMVSADLSMPIRECLREALVARLILETGRGKGGG